MPITHQWRIAQLLKRNCQWIIKQVLSLCTARYIFDRQFWQLCESAFLIKQKHNTNLNNPFTGKGMEKNES